MPCREPSAWLFELVSPCPTKGCAESSRSFARKPGHEGHAHLVVVRMVPFWIGEGGEPCINQTTPNAEKKNFLRRQSPSSRQPANHKMGRRPTNGTGWPCSTCAAPKKTEQSSGYVLQGYYTMLLPAADPNPPVPCLVKLALHPPLAGQKSVSQRLEAAQGNFGNGFSDLNHSHHSLSPAVLSN